MYRVKCAEVWGGSLAVDTDVCTNGLTLSLFSTASGGDQSGGDVYYISVCSHDVLTRVVLADVVGHGAPVSHISRWLYEQMIEKLEVVNGNLMLADLNRIIHERGLEAMTTAAVITFYSQNSGLYFSYAGHPPLLLRRKNKSEWQVIGVKQTKLPSNLPLGILGDTLYDQEEIRLDSGDRILLYTDGVTETMNPELELFGVAKLLEALTKTGDGSLSEIKQTVRQSALLFADGNTEQDDFTVIAIEVD